ncbi:hypothetical protein GGR04_004563 [Aureimonas pseudogalii]|uniref:Uncharacterized protein n=1 Tax=Aureimonas pseudogalii TaxID=1744844 RepID=A0A7W6H8R9_9HYPH|nr:hypothetical protein [Aureimonas pseudogalii]
MQSRIVRIRNGRSSNNRSDTKSNDQTSLACSAAARPTWYGDDRRRFGLRGVVFVNVVEIGCH